MLTRALVPTLAALSIASGGLVAQVGTTTAQARASQVTSSPAAGTGETIGDTCLVGRWRSGPAWYLMKFRKTVVPLHGFAGIVEVHHATGRSVTSYAHAEVGRGIFLGHHLREVVRGRVVSHLHGSVKKGELSYTDNVAHHVTEVFTYRHHVSRRVVNRRYPAQHSSYSCSATSIRTPTGRDTRIS